MDSLNKVLDSDLDQMGRVNKRFQNHLVRIVSIPVFFILVLLIFFHFQNAYVDSLNAKINQLERVRMDLLRFDKAVSNIENELRGFVLSGNEDFKKYIEKSKQNVAPLSEKIFLEIGDHFHLNKKFRHLLEDYANFRTYVSNTEITRDSKRNSSKKRAETELIKNNSSYKIVKDQIMDLDQDVSEMISTHNRELQKIVSWTSLAEVLFTMLLAFFVVFIMVKQLKKLTFDYHTLLNANMKSMKELEASARTKDLFLANMSHEIRTPLGAILGFSELLYKKEGFDSDTRNHISFIKRNSEHLLSMVDDLFDLSRLAADKLDLSIEELRLGEFIQDLENYFSSKVVDKKIDFDIRLDTRIPEKVITDPVRLKQIMTNLVGNAIKFSPEKSKVTVVISYASDQLQFDVIDQGIGIDPKAQQVIFNAFTQADEEHTRHFGGAGLGLSISKKLAELMNGSLLLISSRINIGSHFRLTVPCKSTTLVYMTEKELIKVENQVNSDVEKVSVESETEKFDFSDRRILLAEDSIENQILFKIFIESTRADLVMVDNGTDAVRKALGDDFDLILMDIQMPGLDGYEAVNILRGSQYQKKIIALTAHTMKGEKEKCLKAGFDDYLTKPISQKFLLKKISESLI